MRTMTLIFTFIGLLLPSVGQAHDGTDAQHHRQIRVLKTQIVKLQKQRNTALHRLSVANVTLESLDAKLDQLLAQSTLDKEVISGKQSEIDNLRKEKDAEVAKVTAERDTVQTSLNTCQIGTVESVSTMPVQFIFDNLLPATSTRINSLPPSTIFYGNQFSTFPGMTLNFTWLQTGTGFNFWMQDF